MSLNGKIAGPDGSVDWLEAIPNPDKSDYGYGGFYKEIDTTIQGCNTYRQLLSWGIPFPYPDKKNYVITRKGEVGNTEDVTFIRESPIEFLRELKQQPGKDIWLIGGGEINTLLLNAGLIDQMEVFVMPIILPEGIELFGSIPSETSLTLLRSESFSSGAVLLTYEVVNSEA